MRICVVEWNAASLGGRQRTMLAFADRFVELGHEVTFHTQFLEDRGPGYTKDTFLNSTTLRCLGPKHFVWEPLERRFTDRTIPRAWHDADLILVPYGGYGHIAKFVPGRVVCWVIHPDQEKQADTEVWTNSWTTKKRLLASQQWAGFHGIRIVYPPHDYSPYRTCAKPWFNREIDAICIGSMLKGKRLDLFDATCRALKLRSIIVSGTWCNAKDEQAEVRRSIGHSDLLVDQPAGAVAKLLGRSKLLVITSEAESCPLVVYEALNAGCVVVTRNVGAVNEQLGHLGQFIYEDDEGLRPALEQALSYHYRSADEAMRRGVLFDRHSPTVNDILQESLRVPQPVRSNP